MSTCKTCKFWQPRDESHGNAVVGGYCDKVNTDGGPLTMNGAVAGGYEGYGDYFRTGPDFGCVLHEPK